MIRYEEAESKNPLAFHFYDPEKTVLGRKMKEHLPFATSWRHTLGCTGDYGADERAAAAGAAQMERKYRAFRKLYPALKNLY